MKRGFRWALLAAGLACLSPGRVIAQASPNQDDPQARDRVLRLPPTYNPANNAQAGQATPYGSPPPSRYGGSLLGAPNGQYGPGGAPAGSGQAYGTPYNGAPAQQPGASIPPVQSPRYGAATGDTSAQDEATRRYNGQDQPITQEPLAPLTAPAQDSQDAEPASPQAPGQLAAPAPAPSPDSQGQPQSGDKAASATPAPELPNIWLPAGVAKLQALDKVNAQATTLTVKVGQSATFGSLTITVKSCVVRPPDQPADAAAFVDVADSHPDSAGFSGWLLENEPSISIMQNPIYDIRVTGCA